MPWSRQAAARYAVSPWRPGSAITRRAPVSSGAQNSHTEASKLNGVFCSTASAASSGNVPVNQLIWWTIAPCGTITALGRPVEPEV